MYIVVGSATSAERLKRTAERSIGFPVYVVKTPASIRKGGCSYSVRTDDRALDMIKKIAREKGFSYKGIYKVYNKNGERVYHAVS